MNVNGLNSGRRQNCHGWTPHWTTITSCQLTVIQTFSLVSVEPARPPWSFNWPSEVESHYVFSRFFLFFFRISRENRTDYVEKSCCIHDISGQSMMQSLKVDYRWIFVPYGSKRFKLRDTTELLWLNPSQIKPQSLDNRPQLYASFAC